MQKGVAYRLFQCTEEVSSQESLDLSIVSHILMSLFSIWDYHSYFALRRTLRVARGGVRVRADGEQVAERGGQPSLRERHLSPRR